MLSENIKNWLIIGLVILFIIAVSSLIYSWYTKGKIPGVSTGWQTEPPIKVVTKIKTVEVPVEKIVVVEKQVIVEKLKLPDWIKNNADEQVLATAEIDPYEGKINAAATINIKTGIGQIVTSPQPLSFIAFENKKEVYARAGYDTHWETQISIGGRLKFLRIMSLHMSAYGEVSNRQTGEGVAGLEVSYQW